MHIKFTVISLLVSLCGFQSLAMENDNDQNKNFSIQRKTKYLNEKENKEVRSLPKPAQEIPVGSVIAFAGFTAPDGWLMCDGKQYSSLEYFELYDEINTKYVPNDEIDFVKKFNQKSKEEKIFYVPDLQGRVIVGVGGDKTERVTSNNKLGESGGEENTKLTINQIPKHTHSVGCSPKTQLGGQYPGDILVPLNDNRQSVLTNTVEAGEDQPHNNMQPYQVLNYIIRTGKIHNQKYLNEQNDNQKYLNEQNEKIIKLEKELEIYQRGSAKAWVIFDGSATILDSYGVSSVIKHAAGDFTIKFSKPFNSENYCPVFSAKGLGQTMLASIYQVPQTKSDIRFITFNVGSNGVCAPPSFVSACFFGKQ